jgi:GNAT superfamily N-acetyltransferase
VVDVAARDLPARGPGAGYTVRRGVWESAGPTGPGATSPPPGITIKPFGSAQEPPLRALDRTIRAEVTAWADMPAEVLVRPGWDPSKYAVAAHGTDYVGLLRLTMVTRLPRIGLIAVRADHQRRGIARALLAHTLGALHHVGKETASAEVAESNVAATRLFESIGARRTGSNLELVIR